MAQQSYIVHQLWDALQKDTADRQPLTQVATWVIGEFGDLLLDNSEAPLKVVELWTGIRQVAELGNDY